MDNGKITGRAKKHDGTAIDYVSIFNWSDGKCIAQVKPDQTGQWTYYHYENINVGITYVANGCEPITHGSYSFIGNWAPAALFKNSEKGVWFDPSDLSTLYQDVNKLSPVTANGQPVALMLDKSGNNNHATQTNPSKRPIYRTDGVLHWLDFNGISQFMTVENSQWFDAMSAFTFNIATNISATAKAYSAVFGKLKPNYYNGFNVQPTGGNGIRAFGLSGSRDVDNGVNFTSAVDVPFVVTATWQAGERFYARKNSEPAVASDIIGYADAMDTSGEPLLLGRLSYVETFLCKCRIYGALVVDKQVLVDTQKLIDYSSAKAGLTT